jgi:rhodanese-related sulfurtransferase/quercetin dioxygenase-like cupin family protein
MVAIIPDATADVLPPLASHILEDIASGLATSAPLWRAMAHHDPSRRNPVRLLATDRYEVWVIGWTPGQGVALHDHGPSAGVLTVTEGTLVESASLPSGPVRTGIAAGQSRPLPVGVVHELANHGPEHATSIHVYSPPLTVMHWYDPASLQRTGTEPIAVEPPALPARAASLLLRTEPAAHALTVDELLQQARTALPERATPDSIPAVLERGGVVVDIRPEHLRARDGAIPGAVVIDRNVLEWRLDPSSDHRSPHIRDHDHEVVVVCDEGYASTLAAATLRRLGLGEQPTSTAASRRGPATRQGLARRRPTSGDLRRAAA